MKIIIGFALVIVIALVGSIFLTIKPSITDMGTFYIIMSLFSIPILTSYFLKEKNNDFNLESFLSSKFSWISFVSLIVTFVFLNSFFFTEKTRVNIANMSDNNITLSTTPEKTRVINKTTALKLAKMVMAEKIDGVNISTQFSIDAVNASVQEISGKIYWIFPLDYQSFTRYLNQPHIPGFIKVPATDKGGQAILINDRKMIVSEKSWFSKSIAMSAWSSSNFGKNTYHFEVDDNNVPHWIVSAKKNNIFSGAMTVDYVTIINAETNVKTTVSVDKIETDYPWIDRIIDESQANSIMENALALKNGWFNQTIFGSGENILVPTSYSNQELWYVRINGKGYWDTGLTSNTSADQSLIGMAYYNSITGETLINENISGIDESAAVEAITAALGNDSIKWVAVIPQPIFINKKWFWSAAIVSNSGYFQKVAIVEMKNSKNVFFGSSIKNAADSAAFNQNSYSGKDRIMVSVPKEELLRLQKSLREAQLVIDILISK